MASASRKIRSARLRVASAPMPLPLGTWASTERAATIPPTTPANAIAAAVPISAMCFTPARPSALRDRFSSAWQLSAVRSGTSEANSSARSRPISPSSPSRATRRDTATASCAWTPRSTSARRSFLSESARSRMAASSSSAFSLLQESSAPPHTPAISAAAIEPASAAYESSESSRVGSEILSANWRRVMSSRIVGRSGGSAQRIKRDAKNYGEAGSVSR